jgi:hypothetical protein
MLKRILVFLYLNLVGAVKVAKEQVFYRQRKLEDKGEWTTPVSRVSVCVIFFIICDLMAV